MIIVTMEDMKIALYKSFEDSGKSEEELDEMAEYVMSFFGYKDVIIDNRLRAKDRDIFYKLENKGLLKTDNEEATLKRGKRWRIHYWVLNKRNIIKLSRGEEVEDEEPDYSVYLQENEDIWDRDGE